MTRLEVMTKAQEGKITWLQAADICGMSVRQMRRLRESYETHGVEGLRDGRQRNGQKRAPLSEVTNVMKLYRDRYPDFSVRHFYETACARHGLTRSYTWTLHVLQAHGVADKASKRGTYRRKRERRPMRGMLLHMDASTHPWIVGVKPHDLNVVLDDATGEILFAEFVEQEGTLSTLNALKGVLSEHGRFSELYTDRGSHFCRTETAGSAPAENQNGQVSRVLKTLGIRHILARSPQARGRSERMFGTLQGRLPQELRVAGVRDYAAANRFLKTYLPRFNHRFAVKPAQPEKAFVALVGIDLDMLLSTHEERTVRNDNTVTVGGITLQLPPAKDRAHYVRCVVLTHRLASGELAISYQGRWLARFTRDGEPLPTRASGKPTTIHRPIPSLPVSPLHPPPLARCNPKAATAR